MRNIEKKRYEDIIDFFEDFIDTYECFEDDNIGISVVAKYEHAKEIISCLCTEYDVKSIDISSPDWNEYYDEYLITLLDGEVYCEKCKIDNGYFHIESKYTYLFDDCNSKILNYIHSDKVYEVSIFDEDEEDFESEDEFEGDYNGAVSVDSDGDYNGAVSVDSDGDMHGFTVQKSSENGYSSLSFYSTEKLCACEMQHLMDIFKI